MLHPLHAKVPMLRKSPDNNYERYALPTENICIKYSTEK